jgi:folate-binding protein YgfZ
MEATGTQHTVVETPLAGVHRVAGAKMGVWFDCSLPDDFGDWRREFSFAKQSVALIDKNYRTYLSFAGVDRVRYLNAMLTNNIKDLALSCGTISLLLNPQGHILAEIETYALPDKLFCVSHAMIRNGLVETLDKFIIMDEVTLTDEAERHGTLALEGPATVKLVAELTGVDLHTLPELGMRQAGIGSLPCTLTRRSPGRFVGVEFLTARENLPELWKLLREKSLAVGGGPMGYTALSASRLEQGVPWFGYDFGEKQIPHEAGLENSHISYTKGCYTGQEIVERVRSRGQVNRRRVNLVFSGTTSPPAGEILTVDGKEAGQVTRAAILPDRDIAIGMAYVRKEANAIGTRLDWSGGTATVSKFPDEAS